MNNFLDGIKFGLGFIFIIGIMFGLVYAVGLHSAEEIIGGTFSGNYEFTGNVRFNNNNSLCTLEQKGSIMYNESNFFGCNGTTWNTLNSNENIISAPAASIPTMTAETTNGVTITTPESIYSGAYAWEVGDGNLGVVNGGWLSTATGGTANLYVTFSEPKKLSSYEIGAGYHGTYWLTDLNLYGKNGASWELIESRNGITFSSTTDIKTYILSSPVIYQEYRIEAIDSNDASQGGNGNSVGFQHLAMH